MKDQKFNELLQQIENKTFPNNKISISGEGQEERVRILYALDDNKVILLVNALKKNPNIKIIDLFCNNIGDTGAVALAEVNTLEEVSLYDNKIEVKGAIALANSNLKKLDLSDNFIAYKKTSSEITDMTNAFVANKTIAELNLYNCYVPDEMAAQIIRNNKTIKKLDLSACYLSNESLRYIGDNTTLENLSLYNNNITDLGAKYISQNHSLIDIDFGNNANITEIGAKFLGIHPTLKTIHINGVMMTIDQLREAFLEESVEIVSDNVGQMDLTGDVEEQMTDDQAF
jgi:Leucine-rich repeat (LRR) protein